MLSSQTIKTLRYQQNIQSIEIAQKYGLMGVKVLDQRLVVCSGREWISNIYGNAASNKSRFIEKIVKEINSFHQELVDTPHDTEDLSKDPSCTQVYFSAAKVVNLWNKFVKDKKLPEINYQELVPVKCSTFPEETFTCYLSNEHQIPLIVSPKNGENMPLDHLQKFLQENQAEIKSLIEKKGALLFRGFPIDTAQHFKETLAITIGSNPYIGDGLRNKEIENVYHSTDAPLKFNIPLHNELLFEADGNCKFISFFCKVPPPAGTGQTILGSSKQIATALKTQERGVWQLFENQKIRHFMHHPSENTLFAKVLSSLNPYHRTWQKAYGFKTEEELSNYLTERKIDHRFYKDGTLEITFETPAFGPHPDEPNGPDIIQNQAHLYHHNERMHGGFFTHLAANLIYFKKHTRPVDVEFSNGTPIPKKAIFKILDVLDKHVLRTDWQKGDLLIVENYHVMHGRAPSYKQRLILTSITTSPI